MDETSCFLSLHSPFLLFLQVFCTILWQYVWFFPHKTSAGFLTAYFVVVYKWHIKSVPGKTKRYATVFLGIQRTFSKGLLQRKKFKNGCLSALLMLTDAWLLCRPYPNYEGSSEIGCWIFASLHMRYLVPPVILVSWSLTGMSVWGVERSHSKL